MSYSEFSEAQKIKARAACAKWRERNRGYASQWDRDNRDKRSAIRNKRRDAARAHYREFYKSNKLEIDTKNRAYAKTNREKMAEYQRQFRERHPERSKQQQKKYWSKHPEELRLKRGRHSMVRRARKANSPIVELKRTALFIKSVRSKKSIPCYYCGAVIGGKEAHIDHVLALSKSGNHTSDNLCASCRSCNSKKHDLLITEWKKDGQQILNL